MIGAVIGAGEGALHAIHLAKEHGIYVIAIDGNPNAVGLNFADEGIVADISDYQKIARIVSEKRIDLLLPVPIGRHVACSAYINEKCHLKGASYRSAMLSADKYAFHQLLHKKGLRNIPAVLIHDKKSLWDYPPIYPAIIKPRFGSGSRDIFYISNQDDLAHAASSLREKDEDFIIEQLIQGEEYGIDGAIIENQLYIILVRKKHLTGLPERQAIGSLAVKEKSTLQIFEEYFRKIISVLEYNNCLFNADMILDGQGNPFVIEIAPRPSGHYLSDCFIESATGVDIIDEYIKYQSGEKYSFIPKKIKLQEIRYFDMENVRILSVPSLDKIKKECRLIKWNCMIQPNDTLPPVSDGKSIMHRGFFIVEGRSEADLDEQCRHILKQFDCKEI